MREVRTGRADKVKRMMDKLGLNDGHLKDKNVVDLHVVWKTEVKPALLKGSADESWYDSDDDLDQDAFFVCAMAVAVSGGARQMSEQLFKAVRKVIAPQHD